LYRQIYLSGDEQVTQNAREFAEAWVGYMNSGDFDGLRSLYAENIYANLPSQQRRVEGADVLVNSVREWTNAFPDLRGTLNAVHQDGKTVIIEVTFDGTWSGPLDMPGVVQRTPTNRPMTSDVCEVMELENGKLVAQRPYYDMLAILQQIGALEAPLTAA
jgi:steroid delta-isomerase-like uncharacterized protein